MRVILKNFRVIDEETDIQGTVFVDNGFISGVFPGKQPPDSGAAMIIDGSALAASGALPVLMPAFVDLHAHFRDPGFSENTNTELSPVPENLESASMSAAAGGFGTVVCMANTKPPIDSIKRAQYIKKHSGSLALIDLYPVLSLTKGMEGKELSEITDLNPRPDMVLPASWDDPLMLSEDGKDVTDDALFLAAMKEAKRLNLPISCHCDFGGDENNAVRRVIELGKKALCHIHIAHVSTREALNTIAKAKAETRAQSANTGGFTLSCEAMPHNLCLTEKDAIAMGETSYGRVNPPLRSEEDRKALIHSVADGTIDAIATDHAPHSAAAKEAGAPGFSGFETAFAAVYTELVQNGFIDLKKLSSLMSASPARLLGLDKGPQKRGLILPGYRADIVVADTEASWIVDTSALKTRGKNSSFAGKKLYGKIIMTLHSGRVVFIS